MNFNFDVCGNCTRDLNRYFAWHIKNLNEELAASYGELAACGALNGVTINRGQYVNNDIPEYLNRKQHEILDISSPSTPYELNSLLPLDEKQSIRSQNCAVHNDHAEAAMIDEESNYSAVWLSG